MPSNTWLGFERKAPGAHAALSEFTDHRCDPRVVFCGRRRILCMSFQFEVPNSSRTRWGDDAPGASCNGRPGVNGGAFGSWMANIDVLTYTSSSMLPYTSGVQVCTMSWDLRQMLFSTCIWVMSEHSRLSRRSGEMHSILYWLIYTSRQGECRMCL